jgi:hypothetical protein
LSQWYFSHEVSAPSGSSEDEPDLEVLGGHDLRMRSAFLAGSFRTIGDSLAQKKRQALRLGWMIRKSVIDQELLSASTAVVTESSQLVSDFLKKNTEWMVQYFSNKADAK